MTVTCYNWKVILENFRVRGIDTTSLTDKENGIAGIPFPGGEVYPDVRAEASANDPLIDRCPQSGLEEARLVLKYVLFHGNRLAYAEHVLQIKIECALKLKI